MTQDAIEVDARTARAQQLLGAYLAEFDHVLEPWLVTVADSTNGQAILGADPHTQVAILLATLREVPDHRHWYGTNNLLNTLAQRTLPYATEDVRTVLQQLADTNHRNRLPVQALLHALVRPLADPATLAACRGDVEVLRDLADGMWYVNDRRRIHQLLDTVLGARQGAAALGLVADEWGQQVLPLLARMEQSTHDTWVALLAHCTSGTGSAPSAKWLATAHRLRDALGSTTFEALALDWLGAFRRSSNKPPVHDELTNERTSAGSLLDEANANVLRGLAWCLVGVESAPLATLLADAAIAGYRKITGVGPRSAKVGGACVYALESMSGLHGAAQLERVRLSIKQPAYLKRVEQALEVAARRSGMTRADLEELTVPTYGLDQDGRRRIAVGPAVAELAVVGSDARLRWYAADGTPRKSEPAEVKRDRKAELKDLKRERDDLAHMLAAQRDRLDRLPLAQRIWALAAWRERYLDHPLVGSLARRLIWRFTWPSADGAEHTVDGIWHDRQFVGADDSPLEVPATATVTLWHPVHCDADAVRSWRAWLERHEVSQPFKQAHREVYLLTDAERQTRVYSNRFAAHILRQHQFNALCAARGWRNTLRLMVDDEYPPASLRLPQWGLRAEFWVEGAGDTYETDANEAGTYHRVITDQVRFYPLDAAENTAHAGGGGYRPTYDWTARERRQNEPVPLTEIPALVLSEVLRDVDLFVGVASVGNDPLWQDGGPQGRYRDYWQSYSFGDLSATAETRKELLARLVPRLAIAERCSIEGRYLRVRGDLRTYKIHLGSGNIAMAPNDQYLCIVPARSGGEAATANLFVPFEGDTMLAIILSKAFLLAEDTKITDPTITQQIGRGAHSAG